VPRCRLCMGAGLSQHQIGHMDPSRCHWVRKQARACYQFTASMAPLKLVARMYPVRRETRMLVLMELHAISSDRPCHVQGNGL
jgi:hypothetical protein